MSRYDKYYDLSTELAYIPTNKLVYMIKKGKVGEGWGVNSIITINKTKIFVKSIPVTQLEYNNLFNTANLFDLPLQYNYGLGSAGMNCWRELLTHIKTTNWVLGGDIENFPLMYHYRIVKNTRQMQQWSKKQMDDYIKMWGGFQAIRKYMTERLKAPYEIIICLEYIPMVLYKWLNNDPKHYRIFIDQSTKIIKFLNKKGLIHFDTHAGNYITDGKMIYLTDYGLVLDKEFNLTKQEMAFFKRNTHFDFAYTYFILLWEVYTIVGKHKGAQKKYGFNDNTLGREVKQIIFKNFVDIAKIAKLNPVLMEEFKKKIGYIELVNKFLYDMRASKKRTVIFPNDKVKS